MDYFEAVARRAHVKDLEAEGMVADNMSVRMAIVARIETGEITLEQGQAELRRIKKGAAGEGKVTRAQAFGGEQVIGQGEKA